ncbi:MAG: nuclear transport factor 2 family protein [Pedococcus sp.]
MRHNWAQLFAAMPDLSCEVLASAVDGRHVWSEWEMRGTRPDGSANLMRGVMVFEVVDDLVQSIRFYLEPVDTGPSSVDDAVAAVVRGGPR